MPDRAASYIHGVSEEEQDRLSLLNTLLNERELREIAARPGERVLDVGSGLGQIARGLARAVGTKGAVVGVERDGDQIAGAERLAEADGEGGLVEFRAGDALDLPLAPGEEGSFDLVHSRFVLEHLPDPAAAVREMVRACRPGGRVFLADDDHAMMSLWPPCPEFARTWEAYWRGYNCLGNDPRIGTRLVQLLHQCGATPARNGVVFFGACPGDECWGGYVRNIIEVTRTGRSVVVEHQLLDPESFDRGLDAMGLWSARPDAAIWYPLCWAEGVRP